MLIFEPKETGVQFNLTFNIESNNSRYLYHILLIRLKPVKIFIGFFISHSHSILLKITISLKFFC